MLQVSHSFAPLNLALVTAEAKGTLLQQARENYFRHEYTLDYYLSTFPKPIIAVMDGITSIPALGLSDL
jgi:enoyl-CoA hydratase/carnithine racemase